MWLSVTGRRWTQCLVHVPRLIVCSRPSTQVWQTAAQYLYDIARRYRDDTAQQPSQAPAYRWSVSEDIVCVCCTVVWLVYVLQTRLWQCCPGWAPGLSAEAPWVSTWPTAHLVYLVRRHDHITDALATLHRLRLPERVDFKAPIMVFRVLLVLAPPYSSWLVRVTDLPGYHQLRSSSTQLLHVLPFHRSTVRRGSLPVLASSLWNYLPLDIQSSPSLLIFRQRLKTFL